MATPKPANRIGQVFRLAPCLSSDELLVLLALADYGDRIFPSQAALAAKTRLHISTVKRALTGLRSKQVVTAKGYGKALTYMLHLAHAERGTSLTQSEVVAQAERGGRSHRARDPNTQTNYQPNPPPAEAGRGVAASPWEGIPEDAIRRIRRWVPEGADRLSAASPSGASSSSASPATSSGAGGHAWATDGATRASRPTTTLPRRWTASAARCATGWPSWHSASEWGGWQHDRPRRRTRGARCSTRPR